MSGHTRGPWSVSIGKEHGDFGTIVGYCVEGVKSADGRWVVRFDDDYGTDQGSDARLIAVAPELLEAAKQLLLWSEEFGSERRLDRCVEAFEGAVAKAEG